MSIKYIRVCEMPQPDKCWMDSGGELYPFYLSLKKWGKNYASSSTDEKREL